MNFLKSSKFRILFCVIVVCIVGLVIFLCIRPGNDYEMFDTDYNRLFGIAEQGLTGVDYYFPQNKNGISGKISTALNNTEIHKYRESISWHKCIFPRKDLPLTCSVKFTVLGSSVTVYQKPALAKVESNGKTAYYRTKGSDYSNAVDLVLSSSCYEPNMRKTTKWFDSLNENSDIRDDDILEYDYDGFYGVTFRRSKGLLEAVTASETLTLCSGISVDNVFFYDFTGDGRAEICSTVRDGSGDGIIGTHIEIYDLSNETRQILSSDSNYDLSLYMWEGGFGTKGLGTYRRASMKDEILFKGIPDYSDGTVSIINEIPYIAPVYDPVPSDFSIE